MPNSVKTNKILKVLSKIGFLCIRQKGSHMFFQHPDGRTTLVPNHYEIDVKLLTKIIKKDLKMEKEEFFKLL